MEDPKSKRQDKLNKKKSRETIYNQKFIRKQLSIIESKKNKIK